MIAFLVAGAVGVVVLVVLVLSRRGGGSARIGADGFYIPVRGFRSGSRVSYSCLVGGSRRQGEIEIESGPDEIFVYTGGVPSAITLDYAQDGSSSYGGAGYIDTDDDSPISLPDVSTGSASDDGGGYPPAY